jgi:hypothetical protein
VIEYNQVDSKIQHSLKLIQPYDQDLQHLISLQTDHTKMLERRPTKVKRINQITKNATRSLLEVSRIIENSATGLPNNP